METDDELEKKKEQMRRYMAADRKLEAEKDRSRRRGRFGCIGGFIRLVAIVAAVGGICYAIWLWHPWSTEIDTYAAAERPGECSEGVDGVVTEEHFALFGIRLWKQGGSVICNE